VTGVNQIEAPRTERISGVGDEVVLDQATVGSRQPRQVAGFEIGDDDQAHRPHPFGQPGGHRAVAGAHFQAAPARANEIEVSPAATLEHLLDQQQALMLGVVRSFALK